MVESVELVSRVPYASMSPAELVRACAESGEAAAWEQFVQRFHRLIGTVALRTARHWGPVSPELIDDLVQETYVKICADRGRVLRNFESSNPDAIFGYLKVVTANVVNDYFRATHADKRGAAQTAGGLGALDPAAKEGLNAIEQEIFLKEIDGFLRTQTQRDRQIFWLYYRQGMTAKAIAALPSVGLTIKGVESALYRQTQLVRRHLVEKRSRERNSAQAKGFPAEGSL